MICGERPHDSFGVRNAKGGKTPTQQQVPELGVESFE